MEQGPWTIFDAIIPDFDAPINVISSVSHHKKCISHKIQRVLVLWGSTLDCNCLPLFDQESDEAYLPVGEVWYVDPFLLRRIPSHYFKTQFGLLSKEEYRECVRYLRDLYTLWVRQWCQKFFWAETPYSDWSTQEVCILKRRPVVEMKQWLYYPASTNHGRYTSPGPTLRFGDRPTKITSVPIFLPKKFFWNTSPQVVSARDKHLLQDFLLLNLKKIFYNPYS